MGFVQAFWHLLGALGPALALALGLPLLSAIGQRKRPSAYIFRAQAASIFIACVVTQVVVWVLTGRDGKMVSYAALVLVAASVHTAQSRRGKSPVKPVG